MKNLKDKFIAYADGFLTGDQEEKLMITLKRDHCFNVAEVALELMRSLTSDRNDLQLAEIAGLLHDIGRFVQYRKYRTFSDAKSENHSVLGVQVIYELKLLSHLPEDEQRLICDSILYHNRAAIPAELKSRERLFAEVLRDADKIDIYRVVLDYYENPSILDSVTLELPDTPEITPEVIAALQAKKPVPMTSLRTINDFKICQLAWIHDLNIKRSRQYFRERRYLERMCAQLPDFPEKSALITQLADFLAS